MLSLLKLVYQEAHRQEYKRDSQYQHQLRKTISPSLSKCLSIKYGLCNLGIIYPKSPKESRIRCRAIKQKQIKAQTNQYDQPNPKGELTLEASMPFGNIGNFKLKRIDFILLLCLTFLKTC